MLGRDGPGEQEALAELAAERAQPVELARLLDPLGDDPRPSVWPSATIASSERPARVRHRRPTKSRAILRMSTGNRRR